jgi:signal transduction histidine kinase
MKNFAHADDKEPGDVELNKHILSTLTIARSEWKYVAEVETELGELPLVRCHAGEINQVILNLLVNAAHAIGEVVAGTDRRGTITVRSRRDGDHVIVSIADTGTGIPAAIRHRIFDPFFTTKDVGRGTGQGLAISHAIVVAKHGGELTFETEPGRGSTFFVRLPIHGVTRNRSDVTEPAPS